MGPQHIKKTRSKTAFCAEGESGEGVGEAVGRREKCVCGGGGETNAEMKVIRTEMNLLPSSYKSNRFAKIFLSVLQALLQQIIWAWK